MILLPALHNWFVRQIKDGTGAVVVRLQTLRWPLLAKFAAAVTLFAHTRMYLLLIPVLAWNLDPALGRRLVVLWALSCFWLAQIIRQACAAFGAGEQDAATPAASSTRKQRSQST